LKPLDCAILSHAPQGAGIEKHPCVVLFVVEKAEQPVYIVAWGTTSAPAATETRKHLLVRFGTDEAKVCGLDKDTYFYDDHAAPALGRILKKTNKRCQKGLYKKIMSLVEEELRRIGALPR